MLEQLIQFRNQLKDEENCLSLKIAGCTEKIQALDQCIRTLNGSAGSSPSIGTEAVVKTVEAATHPLKAKDVLQVMGIAVGKKTMAGVRSCLGRLEKQGRIAKSRTGSTILWFRR